MDEMRRAEDLAMMEAFRAEGYCCSQVIVKMALEEMCEENEVMVNAVSALCNGVKTGNNCGALTAAAMVLAMADSRLASVTVMALVDWFKNEYGSVDCLDIIGENREKAAEMCPLIIHESHFKVMELFEEYGLAL